jgi:hypothetical protein
MCNFQQIGKLQAEHCIVCAGTAALKEFFLVVDSIAIKFQAYGRVFAVGLAKAWPLLKGVYGVILV